MSDPNNSGSGWGSGGWGNQPSQGDQGQPSPPQPSAPQQPTPPQPSAPDPAQEWPGQQAPGGQPGFGGQPPQGQADFGGQPGFGGQPAGQPGFGGQAPQGFGAQGVPGGPGFAPQKKKRKVWPWIVGVIVLIVAVVAILQASGVIATSTNVESLSVGDCVILPDETEVTNVDTFPCDRPHDGEVFALITADGGDNATYPGEDAFFEQAVEECIPLFDTYTGMVFEDSPFDIFFLQPTPDGWADGDRGITCIANRLDGAEIEGSIRQ